MRTMIAALLLLAACQANAGSPGGGASAAPSAAGVASFTGLASATPSSTPAAPTPTPPLPVGKLLIGGQRLTADIADTPDSRRQGLSGRASLPMGTGLVLAWDTPTPVQIWMPDMNFAIDVIFVRDEQVVAIYPDAQPCPPGGPCPAFGPSSAVDFVAEVPAGSAKRWGLKVGASATYSR